MDASLKLDANRAVQAALAALLFYVVYFSLALDDMYAFVLSVFCVASLVPALLKSGMDCRNRWIFPAVLMCWMLYLLVSYSHPGEPINRWWPLPLLASTVLLAPRTMLIVALTVLFLLTMIASTQSQPSFLHVTVLPFLTVLLLCLFLAKSREKLMIALQQALGTDQVTGCDNKMRLQHQLQDVLDSLKRYEIPASIILLHVKLHSGERAVPSDAMLQTLCTIWRSRLRITDRLCRLSDDRFVCLLPNTPADKAPFALDDLLKAAAHYEFADKSRLNLLSAIVDAAEMGSPTSGLERLSTWQCH